MTGAAVTGDLSYVLPATKRARVQKGVGLSIATVVVGLFTAFSGVVIELASGFLSDLRHGVCVERLPGDTRPLWHATFRPYNRMRCCGGALAVDHATQECRALSIISSSTPKRFAYALPTVVSFGQEFGSEMALPHRHHRARLGISSPPSLLEVDVDGQHKKEVDEKKERDSGKDAQVTDHKERSSSADAQVGQDAMSVRTHMSHLFDQDPTEVWAEESANTPLEAEAAAQQSLDQSVVNDDVVQTQSESAGNLDPIYEWVPWDRALRAKGRTTALLISILGSAILAFGAVMVTKQAIQAAGSGIPQVRASVAGFALPKHFCARTLLGKLSGLSLCVGSGLAVGKEGPMIHIGAIWGSMLAAPISRIAGLSEILSDTELICVGAAAGVSAAFGAPLAGVLFAVEELGTSMSGGLKYSTMLCAFGAAVVASMCLKYMDLTRTQRLTLFEVDYKQAWAHWEGLLFAVLGMLGGVIGGAFILLNAAIHRRRTQASKDCFCWFLPKRLDRGLQYFLRIPGGGDSRILEVVLLAIVTCISNFPRTITRIPQNDAIFALFSQCHVDPEAGAAGHMIHDPIGLCSGQNNPSFGILWLLVGSACIRFLQTSVTFGALVPAGLFVPSLFIGGCVGRCMGIGLRVCGLDVEPGIYGMVGAGAVLAGVSRLTISLVVVLFELTGGLTYVVPFMISVLTAKWVGDAITDGMSVYDVHCEMGGLAKVEPADDARLLNITMQELCGLNEDTKASTPLDKISAEDGQSNGEAPVLWTVGGLVRMSDLKMHCGVATKGFVVLSTEACGAVEILGWADSNRVLELMASTDCKASSKAERWCRLSSITAGSARPIVAFGSKPFSGTVEDLSEVLEPRGAVSIRHDCPILTALCITQRCPKVKAFVSISGPHFAARTVSRENFLEKLVSGRVRPLL